MPVPGTKPSEMPSTSNRSTYPHPPCRLRARVSVPGDALAGAPNFQVWVASRRRVTPGTPVGQERCRALLASVPGTLRTVLPPPRTVMRRDERLSRANAARSSGCRSSAVEATPPGHGPPNVSGPSFSRQPCCRRALSRPGKRPGAIPAPRSGRLNPGKRRTRITPDFVQAASWLTCRGWAATAASSVPSAVTSVVAVLAPALGRLVWLLSARRPTVRRWPVGRDPRPGC